MSKPMVFNKLIDDAAYDVYIGRPTKWANPYKLNEYMRDVALTKFETLLREDKDLRHYGMDFLTGKRLGCFCGTIEGLSVDDPVICHGQIWLKAIRGDYE